MEICGLWVNIEQVQGPLCKEVGISRFWIYLLMEKGVDSVDGSWTTGGTGPWWTAHRASAVARQRTAGTAP
jgi:hypothetical protein